MISFPLTVPDYNQISRVGLRSVNAVAVSRSPFTFARQVIAHPGQKWEAEIALRPMRRSVAEVWLAWLVSLNGPVGTFLLGDPRACTPLGSAGGTPLVNGSDQTGAELVLDGATASQTGWLKAGDYIQLGSASTATLHKVLSDASSDGTGNVTLDIWPKLRSSPADNDPVVVSNAVGLFSLASNSVGWTADELSVYGITFAAVEAL